MCVPFDWLEKRLHFDTSSFEKTENACSVRVYTRCAQTNI